MKLETKYKVIINLINLVGFSLSLLYFYNQEYFPIFAILLSSALIRATLGKAYDPISLFLQLGNKNNRARLANYISNDNSVIIYFMLFFMLWVGVVDSISFNMEYFTTLTGIVKNHILSWEVLIMISAVATWVGIDEKYKKPIHNKPIDGHANS